MFKKIIASIVLASFVFANVGIYFTKPTYAQESTWYVQEFDDWYQRVYDEENPDEIFGERYTSAQVEWVIYGLWSFLLNHMGARGSLFVCIMRNAGSAADLILECTDDVIKTLGQYWLGGLLGQAGYDPMDTNTSALALAETTTENPIQNILSGERPISGIGYLRDSAAKFNPVSEVQAQGFGFEAASSMRTLWVAVRNVTYFFLVLMIVGMAFMIMFRFKISPQVVITVQSALPKIIITLILITFSYAIAGFMIDLLYVTIGIIAAVLANSDLFVRWNIAAILGGDPPVSTDVDWGTMYNRLAGIGFGQGVLGVMFFYFISFLVLSFIIMPQAFGLLLTTLGISTIIWFITVIIVAIALLVIIIKISWMLIKTFVTILLLIAVGPIFIIVGGFGGWLKTLASHLAVFAAIGPMLAISYLFMASAVPDNLGILGDTLTAMMPFQPAYRVFGDSTWVPPFLPGGGGLGLVWLFASFVVITLIPNVANIIKSRIQGRPFGYGTAVGAAIGVGAGTAWSPFGSQIAATRDAWAKGRGQAIYASIADSKFGQKLKGVIGH